jgi:hypothetical protein
MGKKKGARKKGAAKGEEEEEEVMYRRPSGGLPRGFLLTQPVLDANLREILKTIHVDNDQKTRRKVNLHPLEGAGRTMAC